MTISHSLLSFLAAERCKDGQIKLFDSIVSFDGNVETISGFLQICIDGEYYFVCAAKSDINYDPNDIAHGACHVLGYNCKLQIFVKLI